MGINYSTKSKETVTKIIVNVSRRYKSFSRTDYKNGEEIIRP